MMTMAHKTEFVKQAIQLDLFKTANYIWMDIGIRHMTTCTDEEFTQKININELLPGDLIFFGDKRVDHVALYVGEGLYIHSSGKATGRNGIAVDPLVADHDAISHHYFQRFWSCGRVVESYIPPILSGELERLS
jgi:uncharacterized protein YfaT (DUF1175 family)